MFRRIWCHGLERFCLELSVFLQQDFYLAFRLFQFSAAGGRKLHAFFKEGERLFQCYFASFQLLNNLFQSLKTLFKLGQRISLRYLL
jgi:hypothetical protein